MFRATVKVASAGLIYLLLHGCAYFTPPLERPVIEEKLNASIFSPGMVGTLSLTPERRVVLVNFYRNRFCAEAPTEVGSDVSRFFQATAEADVPSEVKAKIGAIMAAASSNSVLNRRTQGMQLFLANSYFVCQMYMNGAINEKQLLEYQMSVFNSAASLIEKEIPLLYKQADSQPDAPRAFKPLDTNQLLRDVLKLQDSAPSSTDGQHKPQDPPEPIPSVTTPSTPEAPAADDKPTDPSGKSPAHTEPKS